MRANSGEDCAIVSQATPGGRIARTGDPARLVVDEATPGQAAVIEHDLFVDPAAEQLAEEAPYRRHIAD
jgi:hypothetical protein